MSIKQDVIDGLKTSLMENGGEEWVKEKMTLVDRISETKLALSALEETYEEERSRHVATRIMKEDLELQVDKITKVCRCELRLFLAKVSTISQRPEFLPSQKMRIYLWHYLSAAGHSWVMKKVVKVSTAN